MIESGNFNQVPLIMGSNADEGLISALTLHSNQTLLEALAENWENEFAPLVIFHRLVADQESSDFYCWKKELDPTFQKSMIINCRSLLK
jgi:hypothetical protein